jgi:hypothetical protein
MTDCNHFTHIKSEILAHASLINPIPSGTLSLLTTPFSHHQSGWQAYVVATSPHGLARILCSAWNLGGEVAAMRELLRKMQGDTARILRRHKLGEGFEIGARGMGGVDTATPRGAMRPPGLENENDSDSDSDTSEEDFDEWWTHGRRGGRTARPAPNAVRTTGPVQADATLQLDIQGPPTMSPRRQQHFTSQTSTLVDREYDHVVEHIRQRERQRPTSMRDETRGSQTRFEDEQDILVPGKTCGTNTRASNSRSPAFTDNDVLVPSRTSRSPAFTDNEVVVPPRTSRPTRRAPPPPPPPPPSSMFGPPAPLPTRSQRGPRTALSSSRPTSLWSSEPGSYDHSVYVVNGSGRRAVRGMGSGAGRYQARVEDGDESEDECE